MPVENNGSMNAAADGSIAHRSPAAAAARYASRGIHVNDLIGRASANCAAIDGYRASSRAHAGSPSASFSSSASQSSTATPALVTPFPNRSTHIQPPSNTWCSAASSIG